MAAIALGQIEHPAALSPLYGAMLEDDSGELRREATRAWTTVQRLVRWRR